MQLKIPPPKNVTNLVTNPDPSKFNLNRFLRGDVLICRETWLIAYKDQAEFDAAKKKHFSMFNVEKQWRCGWCGRLHFTGDFPLNTNKSHAAKGNKK